MSTTRAVTARVAHYCCTCQPRATKRDAPVILPGHRHLRHVAFPGDEAVGGDRPWVLRECATCAIARDDVNAVLHGICGADCHGVSPCVLPVAGGTGHDCVCRDCLADDAARVAEAIRRGVRL